MGSRLSKLKKRLQLKFQGPGALANSTQTPCITVPSPESAVQEQGKEETTGPGDCHVPSSSGSPTPTDENEEKVITGVAPVQEEGKKESPGPGDCHVPSSSASATPTDENEEKVITGIRAADVALGLRRVPAGFYTVVHHSGLEWRTENKRSSVDEDIVEWSGPIPIPSDPSSTVCIKVYASFEFHPTLGAGEQLRELPTTVKELFDRSGEAVPFIPEDGDVVSPCSSMLITVERRKRENNHSSASRVLCSTTESRGELEDATNQGHSALSRYRKHGEKRDLECSIEEFERALSVCPEDHPCRAAAQSNLAMAIFILSRVEDTDASLEVPLSLYRNALVARPAGHVDRPSTLIQLAAVHFVRSQKQRNEDEGVQAEALLYEVMELSSADSHEMRAATFILQMHAGRRVDPVHVDGESSEEDPAPSISDEGPLTLSGQLVLCYERFGDLAHLQEAITLLENWLRSTSVLDDRRGAALAALGLALAQRFDCVGELSDLEDAISMHRDALDLTPHGRPERLDILSNLGTSFLFRFQRLGQLSDLGNAISRYREAVDLTPHGHPQKPDCLSNLGHSLSIRFQRLGELSDLDDAISMLRDAVDLTPDGHPGKSAYLNNLGNSILARFQRFGELSDLEDAISMLKEGVDLIPDGHPDKSKLLSNLGGSFISRFQRLGQPCDLEDAISTLRDAVDLSPNGHPDKPELLSNLGGCFFTRFQHLGQLNDLEDAISRHKDAVELTPHAHPVKPNLLNSLGISFWARFERLGELSDLDGAISTFRDVVDLTQYGHPQKRGYLINLGSAFATRFDRLGELSDLEDAISRLVDAIDLTPHDHPEKPTFLNNLANSLTTRFRRLGESSDLANGISRHRDAVDLTPHDHPDKPHRLHNLANSLIIRFGHFGELSDLQDAISRYRDAVDLTPHGHPQRPAFLSSLGNSLATRFERLEDSSDLEDAISKHKDAVDLTPHGHPDKPARLICLGSSLSIHFYCFRELRNLEQAISLYLHAASTTIAPISVRFLASTQWILCARPIRHHTLLHAYSIAITLLPQLAWIGLSLSDRYTQLTQGADLVREAAAAALDLGFPETAVEWLEQGRSIVWGELFQLRSSYEELSSAHPDHARRLRELSAALEHASSTRERSLSLFLEQTQSAAHRVTESLQQEADRHRTLAIERDKLLQEIRGFPGFEQFLLRKEFSQLRASAHSGPVVMLNAAETRCDALIVLADIDHVIHVPLPNFTCQRSAGLRKMLVKLLGRVDERMGTSSTQRGVNWEPFLSTLWNGVVKPVLDALSFSTPGDLSRIFWCPTGHFVFLPIHGAGFYNTQHSRPGHKVSDFVVSSYVPSLSILSLSHNPDAVPSGDLRLLAVRQPSSDGLPHLSGVGTELEHIRAAIRNSSSAQTVLLESEEGTVEEVLSLMKDADWVHFACHGSQDDVDRTNSGLCLADRRRLKISDIMALSRPHGGLAFLSACETAMGDEGLSDEAIHIAAGMLFAGYGGVVGTMWTISDELAPRVARDVYSQLFRNGARPDYREAARALHDAIGHLRDSVKAPFDMWLPFIHVGL